MKVIGSLLLEEFKKMNLARQHAMLMYYVDYVEQAIEEGETPLFFLEWFLMLDTKEQGNGTNS